MAKKKRKDTPKPAPVNLRPFLFIYIITLLAFSIASYFPNLRLWGFGVWAHYPVYVPVVVLLVGLGLLFAIHRLKIPSEVTTDTKRDYFWVGCFAVILVSTILFILFRARTHFLGDGYQNLALLASDHTILKKSSVGEILAHIFVRDLIGGERQTAALISYQSLSIIAGLLYGVIAAITARKLLDDNRRQILFFLGVFFSGYSLLFFGYVENYSLFVLSVGAFMCLGLLALNDNINRFWLVPVVIASVFLHVLGVTLLPSIIYVLLRNTKAGKWFKRLSVTLRTAVLAVVAILILFGIYRYYDTDFFIQYSILTLFPDFSTIDGYTLLSLEHLIDIINLMVLLLPPVGLFVFALTRKSFRISKKEPAGIFLIVTIAACFAAVFLFDPKLGMPRDWDLFAFWGIPLTMMFYWLILRKKESISVAVQIVLLSLILGIVSLSARVSIANSPTISEKQVKGYLYLDRKKGRNSWLHLANYYNSTGDSAQANLVLEEWNRVFPERVLFLEAYRLKKSGDVVTAKSMLENVVRNDPYFPDAWSNLGEILQKSGNLDSSYRCYLRALSLNPYEQSAYSNLGGILFRQGRYDEAAKIFKKAMLLADTVSIIHFNLALAYRGMGDIDSFERSLIRASEFSNAPGLVFKELGDLYLKTNRTQLAAEYYQQGLSRGLDSGYVTSLCEQNPALKAHLKR